VRESDADNYLLETERSFLRGWCDPPQSFTLYLVEGKNGAMLNFQSAGHSYETRRTHEIIPGVDG
jgi:hypothetical protein